MEWLCLALQLHWASHPPGVAGAAVLQCCRLHMSAAGTIHCGGPRTLTVWHSSQATASSCYTGVECRDDADVNERNLYLSYCCEGIQI